MAAVPFLAVVKLAVLEVVLEILLEHSHRQMMPGTWVADASHIAKWRWVCGSSGHGFSWTMVRNVSLANAICSGRLCQEKKEGADGGSACKSGGDGILTSLLLLVSPAGYARNSFDLFQSMLIACIETDRSN